MAHAKVIKHSMGELPLHPCRHFLGISQQAHFIDFIERDLSGYFNPPAAGIRRRKQRGPNGALGVVEIESGVVWEFVEEVFRHG